MKKSQKVVLITGGAHRLGACLVKHFAEKGWSVILHCCSHIEQARQIAAEIESLGGECSVFQADFAKIAEIKSFTTEIRSKYDHIGLLINNSAVFARFDLEHSTDELIEQTLSVNLNAPLILIRDFADILGGGQVINIIDAKILRPDSRYFVYSLSKFGLEFATRLASQEFAERFRVNGVACGMLLHNENFAQYEKFVENIPLKDSMSVDKFFMTIDFLLENSYITGQTITVDGGYYNILR